MLISISAKADDPNDVDWYQFTGKKSIDVTQGSSVKLDPESAFGLRMLRNGKDYYLCLIEKPSQKIKIPKTRVTAILKNSISRTYKQAEKLKRKESSSRAGVGGRQSAATPFDHPRFRPKQSPSPKDEKKNGVDPKDYQWRVYKGTKPLQFKENAKRAIELDRNEIIGLRFEREARGGFFVTPEGLYRRIPTKLYDTIVSVTDILPKNKWSTRLITPDMIKEANKTDTELAMEEARQRKQREKQEREERKLQQERERKRKEEEARREQEALEEFLATKDQREQEAKDRREQEVKAATVDPSAYIRDNLNKELDADVIDALDMDDLEDLDLELQDIGGELLDLDEEFEPEETATNDVVDKLKEMLEAHKQEAAEQLGSELDSAADDADAEEETEEETEETEEDADEEDGDDEIIDTDDPNLGDEDEDVEAESEESTEDDSLDEADTEDEDLDADAEDEDLDAEDEDEDLDADAEDEDFDIDEPDSLDGDETSDETSEDEDEDPEVQALSEELDSLGLDDDEETESSDDNFDDEEAEEVDEDTEVADDFDEEADDLDSNDDDSDFDIDSDDDDELDDIDSDDSADDDWEDEEETEEDSSTVEDADAALDTGDIDDADVDAAEQELADLESDVDAEVTEDDNSTRMPEEADVISFNDDPDNRSFVIIDASPSPKNDQVMVLKLYDITNEPNEYNIVRYTQKNSQKFLDSITIEDRVNGKLFSRYADEVEELDLSKESLI